MVIKEFEMFYFDDETFISLCKQIEKELRALTNYSTDNVQEIRLAYQKFELFLSVYYNTQKRNDIDYKPEQRIEVAAEINQFADCTLTEVTEDYQADTFLSAKEKLERVLEDLIYQITMKNLSAPSAADNLF